MYGIVDCQILFIYARYLDGIHVQTFCYCCCLLFAVLVIVFF